MPDDLAAYQARLESLAVSWLGDYVARLKRLSAGGRPKEVNDPIWGTLHIRPDEVLIIDSPLLQRLRRIKQLGVVHLVYPAATHSRFEHSLGVLHQVQRLISAVNERGLPHEEGGPITRPVERILRLAALCHDVGHGALSHVSEYALDNERTCENIRLAFQAAHRTPEKHQLSEITAYLIIGSPAFGDLLEQVQRITNAVGGREIAPRIQAAIIGRPIDNATPLLHEFVTGPFDADKLDYLPRDATMCGVPAVTDVPRLVEKVRAVRVDRERLPAGIKPTVSDSPSGYVLTGIARSGGSTLDELALARVLMFDKVYRHHKVRAAESMVFSLLARLVQIADEHPAVVPLLLGDDDLFTLNQDSACALAGRPFDDLDDVQQAAIRVAADIADRLRARRIWARGFAYAPVMPQDDYREDPEHSAGLKQFIADTKSPRERAELVQDVVSRLITIVTAVVADGVEVSGLDVAAAVGEVDQIRKLTGDDLTPYIWFSPPRPVPKTSSSDTGHAFLIDEQGNLLQAEEDAAETIPWADAYVATRDLGHVFCPPDIAPLVYLATEAMVRVRYGVRMPRAMLSYAKQDAEALDELRRGLENAGWYEGLPPDLRPLPEILERADAKDRVQHVADNLRGYSGPYQAPTPSQKTPKSTVRPDQVVNFVRQFPGSLVDAALKALQSVRVIGRDEANAALAGFITANPQFIGGSYVPLGEAKDSSAIITYYVGDEAVRRQMTARSLASALALDQPILFVDDFIGRGSQSVDIVEAWLGTDRSQQLGEEREGPLAAPLIEALRQRQLGFLFVAGFSQGADALKARLNELGLNAHVGIHIAETDLPFLDKAELPPKDLEPFREFCSSTAAELFRADGRAEDWIADRVLGYGNRGLLLVSTYNTPSATLTCLWKGGTSTEAWQPLLPRRPKK